MISYIIFGILLVIIAAIYLGQNIYIANRADKKDPKEIKKATGWGIAISSIMIVVGLLIIGISMYMGLRPKAMEKSYEGREQQKHLPGQEPKRSPQQPVQPSLPPQGDPERVKLIKTAFEEMGAAV